MNSMVVNPVMRRSIGEPRSLEPPKGYSRASQEQWLQQTHRCRGCGSSAVREVFSFGSLPLANSFAKTVTAAKNQICYPLNVIFCESCYLLQIANNIESTQLFRTYKSYNSIAAKNIIYAQELVKKALKLKRLSPDSLVIEVGSNDGHLLKNYVNLEVPVLGIEPAIKIAEEAQEKGIPTLPQDFSPALGARLASEGRRADVVHAHRVLSYYPEPNVFVRGLEHIISRTGIAIIEVPYVFDLMKKRAFDGIRHEYFCYFSLSSLDSLFRRSNLRVRDVERVDSHGGSLRLFVDAQPNDARSLRCYELLEEERRWGVSSSATYRNFYGEIESVRKHLYQMLTGLKAKGKKLAAYGASARGSILVNYLGIGADVIDFVVDKNPSKQGMFVPGVGIPIVGTESLPMIQPDYCIILSWTYTEEILQQQSLYRQQGGRFIVPFPFPKIITAESEIAVHIGQGSSANDI